MSTKKIFTLRKVWQYSLRVPILVFILTLGQNNGLIAQNQTDDVKQPPEVRTQPSFQGDLLMYVASHVKYRDEARQNKEEGTAVVRFVVELDGSLSHIEGIEGPKLLSGILLEEAVRMVKVMPKWNPATAQDGKPVRCWYTLPVKFRLN